MEERSKRHIDDYNMFYNIGMEHNIKVIMDRIYISLSDNKIAREAAIYLLLKSIGEDPDREGLIGTPDRIARMYTEIYEGYSMSEEKITEMMQKAVFTEDGNEDMVIIKDIPFYSNCEHHMVTFFGTVDVAYIPKEGKIVGLSKLPRLVDAYAKRLQLQERLTKQIADKIVSVLNPLGVMVVIRARHMCVESRGSKKPGAITITSAVRGVMRDNPAAREEAVELLTKTRKEF